MRIGAWLGCSFLAACAAAPEPWQNLTTGSDASLRGLCAVSRDVVWASGSGGTVLRSVDGGANWQPVGPADGAALDFRDVFATDADNAVILVAGTPARLLHTVDGGRSWRIGGEDPRAAAFFDGLCANERGDLLAFGDPVDGAFVLWRCAAGTADWRPLPIAVAPVPGEAGFAASGSNLLWQQGRICVVTGGALSRALISGDDGANWSAAPLPLRHGEASQGAFSVAMAPGGHLVAVGGDYRQPEAGEGTAAWSDDGGRTWHASATGAGGYRSAVTWLSGSSWLAVGERGASRSDDGGATWRVLDGEGFHTLARAPDGTVFAAGSNGRVARCAVTAAPPAR